MRNRGEVQSRRQHQQLFISEIQHSPMGFGARLNVIRRVGQLTVTNFQAQPKQQERQVEQIHLPMDVNWGTVSFLNLVLTFRRQVAQVDLVAQYWVQDEMSH